MKILVVLVASFLVLVFVLVFCLHHKIQNLRMLKCNIFSQKSLNDYLNAVLKKRKIVESNLKNNHKTAKTVLKYSYLQFILPKISKLSFEELVGKTKSILFPEGFIKDNVWRVFEHGDLLVCSHEKFRAVRGRIVILEIAKAYVFLSLNDKTFDMITHFKRVTSEFKLFKKEIQILPRLVKYFFAFELLNLGRDLQSMRKQIENAKNMSWERCAQKQSYIVVYALAKYRPKLLEKIKISSSDVMDACFHLSKDLLETLSKIKAVFLWCDVL